MSNPEDLLVRMQDLCGFMARLSGTPAELLQVPMAKGKWSIQEVVAHIMVYDETFLHSVVLALTEGKEPRAPDPADNQSFNESAAAVGRNMTKEQLIARAIRARRELVDHLRRLPAQAFDAKLEGSGAGDLAELLNDDFVSHDRIHVKQMEEYLDRGLPVVEPPDSGSTG